MRCDSHLSDDDGEQIGLLKALGHSVAQSLKRSVVRNRQSHAQKMPWLQDLLPGDPQRAWERGIKVSTDGPASETF